MPPACVLWPEPARARPISVDERALSASVLCYCGQKTWETWGAARPTTLHKRLRALWCYFLYVTLHMQ